VGVVAEGCVPVEWLRLLPRLRLPLQLLLPPMGPMATGTLTCMGRDTSPKLLIARWWQRPLLLLLSLHSNVKATALSMVKVTTITNLVDLSTSLVGGILKEI